MKNFKKLLSLILVGVLVFALVACGEDETSGSSDSTNESTSSTSEKSEDASSTEKVVINFFTNVPDRSAGLGMLEQMNIDAFVADNPEYEVVVEALSEEPYKQKLKAYMAGNDMPDVWQQWAQTADLAPIANGGYALELNPDDYSDYKFVAGALDAFTIDGKLYGLPKNTDYWVVYYNQQLFEEYGVEVPTTTDELIEVAKVFNDNDIIPMTYPGQEKWASVAVLHTLAYRFTGSSQAIKDAVYAGTMSNDNSGISSAVTEMTRLAEAGVFASDFNTADYGSARNLFAQGQAAMYTMGSWEMGLGSDTNIDPAVRDNIRAIAFPTIEGQVGTSDQLVMWFGGGYSIAKDSAVQEGAKKLVDYIMQPSVYSKNAWATQTVMPPQNFAEYVTGDETDLQKDLVAILEAVTETSGSLYNDLHDSEYKVECEELTQKVLGGIISVEEYVKALDAEITK